MDEEIFGTDLMLRVESRQEYLGLGADLMVGKKGDLEKVSGRENLGQALLHRLLTRRGELAALGHPEYGSRLHELIGEPNNENTRDLVRLYAKECILQEPRVKDIVAIKASVRDDPSAVSLDITVLPVKSSVPMNLVFPYFLEVG
jgi:phage baseplate assembly protein W